MFKFMMVLATSCLAYVVYNNSNGIEGNELSLSWTLGLMSVMMLILAASSLFQTLINVREERTRLLPHTLGKITSVSVSQFLWFERKISIDYSYLVDDVDYRGNRFSIYSSETTEGALNLMPGMRGFKDVRELEGKRVSVYYNPKRPSDSILNKAATKSLAFYIIPPIVIILSCFYVLYNVIING